MGADACVASSREFVDEDACMRAGMFVHVRARDSGRGGERGHMTRGVIARLLLAPSRFYHANFLWWQTRSFASHQVCENNIFCEGFNLPNGHLKAAGCKDDVIYKPEWNNGTIRL